MPRPVVAITCDRRAAAPAPPGPRVRPVRAQVQVYEGLVDRVRGAGALALLLPPGDAGAAAELLELADALVITGGAFDIHPSHYGQAVHGRLDAVDEARTGLELALAREAVRRDLPLLGICGGMQALAVALGGTLLQDIASARPGALQHEQPTDPAEAWHPVRTEPGWAGLWGEAVNSTHHQAVDGLGPLDVAARAPDGVVEAVALPGARFCLGVQWHPELLDDRLFLALVDACSR